MDDLGRPNHLRREHKFDLVHRKRDRTGGPLSDADQQLRHRHLRFDADSGFGADRHRGRRERAHLAGQSALPVRAACTGDCAMDSPLVRWEHADLALRIGAAATRNVSPGTTTITRSRPFGQSMRQRDLLRRSRGDGHHRAATNVVKRDRDVEHVRSRDLGRGDKRYELCRVPERYERRDLRDDVFSRFPLTQDTAYRYVVHARIGTAESADSAPDYATTVMFTEDSQLKIRAVDITTLRTAVRALRSLAGLSAYSFTDADNTLPGLAAKGIHIQQLRDALNQARTSLGFAALSFTDPNLDPATNGGQHLPIRYVHITQLRGGVQ